MAENGPSEATRTQFARSILTKNLKVKPGERIIVEAWTHTLPWSVAFLREARRLGASPIVLYEDEGAYWDSIEEGEAKRLGTLGRHEWDAIRQSDVYIHMWGPGDRVRLNGLPSKTQQSLFAWNDEWYKVAARADVRGARLEVGRPYPQLAKAYGVDEGDWMDQVVRASMVDPERLAKSAAPIRAALARGRRLRIRHSNGTDLTVGLSRRPVRQQIATVLPPSQRGPFDRLVNVPGGAVGTALDESVADGVLVSNRTNYYDDGTATGAVLHFAKGRLTEATFDTGEERFKGPFAKGGKGRDQPGMLRIGLNPELHNTPQLEDIERGAVMVSVGGNKFSGGRNASPFFGWAICAGAKLEVDGRPVAT